MSRYEPYSRRLARINPSTEFEYDQFPESFRVQIVHILDDMIGRERNTGAIVSTYYGESPSPVRVWELIFDLITRERGLLNLYVPLDEARNPIRLKKQDQLRGYIIYEELAAPLLLDAIEIAFRTVGRLKEYISAYPSNYVTDLTPSEGVDELNHRLRQHRLGYSFSEEVELILRLDSQYVHAEIVDPALRLLHSAGLAGAEAEFARAQEHYRHGRHEEAMSDALKAFESTMKHICDERSWAYDPSKDTANDLINIVLKQGLVPSWATAEFTALRSILESGVPTARNRNAGHGRGGTPRQIPDYLAAFTLHMSAANIVFLAESHRALPLHTRP